MANRDFNIPIKGYADGLSPDRQPPLTTGYMDNIYPRGTLEKKVRLTQRPGVDKTYSEQISNWAMPVVFVLSVTTVD